MKEMLYAVRCLKSNEMCLKSNEDMMVRALQRSWVRIPLSHLNFSGS